MEEYEKIEKVEKLSSKAGVSLEAARAALETNNWDMLDALICLQNQAGFAQQTGPNQTGPNQAGPNQTGQQQTGPQFYSTEGTSNEYSQNTYEYQNKKSTSFGEAVGKGIKWCGDLIKKGMDNFFIIEKDNMKPINIPITIAVILLFILNGFALFLLIVGLFFGFRYSFGGPDFSRSVNDVNDTLHNVGQQAQNFTNDIKDGFKGN